MRMNAKVICSLGLGLLLAVTGVWADEPKADIYEVTGSALMVRESPDTKSKILFKVPKGGFILNVNDSMQNQDVVTISGKSGRWLRVMGPYSYVLGYAFEGFLERKESLTYRDLEENCKIMSNRIQCGKDLLVYAETTPVAGTYFSEPGECHGGPVSIYEKNSAILNKILVSQKPDEAAGANAIMVTKGKKILQFIVAPPPRGGGC